MKEFIEKMLKKSVEISEYEQTDKLPLLYSAGYYMIYAQIDDIPFLILEPREDYGLSQIRKQCKKIAQLTDLYCVLYFTKLTSYTKNKMLEEGIPFILEGKQLYLPFLGMLLKNEKERILKPCQEISFLTQKLLLSALYENWQDMNVTRIAERLGVAKTSITRCMDELEVIECPYIVNKSRSRLICVPEDKREMWKELKRILRNPLLKTYYLEKEEYKDLRESGISALCRYSMLADNRYRTYAVLKKDITSLNLMDKSQVPAGEVPGQIVQELGYIIDFNDKKAIDPLTTVLLLSDMEKEDPRVEKAIEEMLEDYVW